MGRGVWVRLNCMKGRVPGVLLIAPKLDAFLNFSKTVNTLFEIETEKTFLASRSFAISPLVLGTTVTLNKIEDSLQTVKIVLFLLYLLHPSYGDN